MPLQELHTAPKLTPDKAVQQAGDKESRVVVDEDNSDRDRADNTRAFHR